MKKSRVMMGQGHTSYIGVIGSPNLTVLPDSLSKKKSEAERIARKINEAYGHDTKVVRHETGEYGVAW